MKVLQFWSDQHPGTPVDLFIDVPFDFEAELARATRKELRSVGAIPIVTLPTLVKLKRAAPTVSRTESTSTTCICFIQNRSTDE